MNAVCITSEDNSGVCRRPDGVSSGIAAICVLDPLEDNFNVARHLSPLHRTEIIAQMAVDLAKIHEIASSSSSSSDDSYSFIFERI